MARTKLDIKPLYAGVGVTDLAVGIVRDLVTGTQTRIAGVTTLAKDARVSREAIEARVADLQSEVKAYPAKVQALIDDNAALVNGAYADLVQRGETLVGRIRGQESSRATAASARTTLSKAKTTRTQTATATAAAGTAARTTTKKAAKRATTATRTVKSASAAPARKAATARGSAKASVTAARKSAANAATAAVEAAEKVGD